MTALDSHTPSADKSYCQVCRKVLGFSQKFIPLIFVDYKSSTCALEQDVLTLPVTHEETEFYTTLNIDSNLPTLVGEWTNICGTNQYRRSTLSPFTKPPYVPPEL